MSTFREQVKLKVFDRKERACDLPRNPQGKPLKVSSFFGCNVFDPFSSKDLKESEKKELKEVIQTDMPLEKELAKSVANAVLNWAIEKGATHFCHWFQPLTGATAEKHDAFLSFEGNRPIEKLSASQLMQGEPDASSFPHGGSRSTFEARGYTTWDLTSPIFIDEHVNGKTLIIPTAFVSYHGNALDIKTPLLRSVSKLSEYATEFLKLCGEKNTKRVSVTVGCEQEYFLVDKAFYFSRPDLVMCGRTLIGNLTTKNQQLSDHYFGRIPKRVQAFMNEAEVELYKAGIPAKTRHNEVAPGQFELAPVFSDANVANDQNQMVMSILQSVAQKHDFVCLLHEKPFSGINGSGKHVNWSMSSDEGINLLEPGNNPHENHRFLATVAMTVEAVKRHQEMIRFGIASHSNDHRLGANEAPPSIISVFLGDTLEKIFNSLTGGDTYVPNATNTLDLGAQQLANLLKDNTDRNRTSPFAFTGNKFELRAVGSSAAVGLPLTILNTAVADVMKETNEFIKQQLADGKDIEIALLEVARKWYSKAQSIVFNGDGYSEEWVKEAQSRGLSNLRTTADALEVFKNEKYHGYLIRHGVMRAVEIETRYNVSLEQYNTQREIEFMTLKQLIEKNVLPSVFEYKSMLAETVQKQKVVGSDSSVEEEILRNVSHLSGSLYSYINDLTTSLEGCSKLSDDQVSLKIANELLPLAEKVADVSNRLENIVPNSSWTLPKYYDLLFIR